MFVVMERRYELETLRRSLAMLRPGAPALDREEAMRLVRELQDLERQLRTLRRGLQELLAESGGTKSAAWRGQRPPVS
jgi:vacuolar-type H+-ATPase subunit D/Vma8